MKHLACLEKLLDLGAKIDVHDVAGLKDGAVGTKNVVTRSKNVKKFETSPSCVFSRVLVSFFVILCRYRYRYFCTLKIFFT